MRLTLVTIGEQVALAPARLLAGGVAGYVCGELAFRRALCIPSGGFGSRARSWLL